MSLTWNVIHSRIFSKDLFSVIAQWLFKMVTKDWWDKKKQHQIPDKQCDWIYEKLVVHMCLQKCKLSHEKILLQISFSITIMVSYILLLSDFILHSFWFWSLNTILLVSYGYLKMFLSCTKKLDSKIKCADFQLQYPKVFEEM